MHAEPNVATPWTVDSVSVVVAVDVLVALYFSTGVPVLASVTVVDTQLTVLPPLSTTRTVSPWLASSHM